MMKSLLPLEAARAEQAGMVVMAIVFPVNLNAVPGMFQRLLQKRFGAVGEMSLHMLLVRSSAATEDSTGTGCGITCTLSMFVCFVVAFTLGLGLVIVVVVVVICQNIIVVVVVVLFRFCVLLLIVVIHQNIHSASIWIAMSYCGEGHVSVGISSNPVHLETRLTTLWDHCTIISLGITIIY